MDTYLLNTSNIHAITYQTETLLFTLIGGVRTDGGLDRMRVTLKIELCNPPIHHLTHMPSFAGLAIRHNLDLYNDSQLEKLARKTAERLRVELPEIMTALADITTQLEKYRLAVMEVQDVPEQETITITDAAQKEAQAFLSTPDLLTRTNTLIQTTGVVGEEVNRLLMYLIFTTRKREHPLHILSFAPSGTGKTYLQENISRLIPPEDVVETTSLSENAFYYFGQQELRNKLLLIEDLSGAEQVLYPLRELMSKRKIQKTVATKDSRGTTKTIHLTVEGPLCVAGCTTEEAVYEDNANRSFLIYLDNSKEQDERIMDRQRQVSAGLVNKKEEQRAITLLQNCQRILKPIAVRNPFAQSLKIPSDVFKPRRTNAHYLNFIEAVCFYHQYQRQTKTDPTTGETYIECTLEDISQANTLITDVLIKKSDELTTATRQYFEALKEWLTRTNTTTFTAREARHALRVNVSNQKRYLKTLLEAHYLARTGNKTTGFTYEVASFVEFEELKSRITTVLDTLYTEIQRLGHSPEVVHS